MRRFLVGLAVALLWFGQANAVPAFWTTYGSGGITVLTGVASNAQDSGCGSPTQNYTTAKTVPAGDLIVVWVQSASGDVVSGVADDVGNVYNKLQGPHPGSHLDIWYAVNAVSLPSGDHITLSRPGGSGSCYMAASAFGGITTVTPLDQSAENSGTSTSPSLSSGVLTDPVEVVLAGTFVTFGGFDTFTEAPGFTTDATVTGSSALHTAYEITITTSSVTYAPTLGTSRAWLALLATYIGVQ